MFDRGENMLQVVNIKQSPIGTEKAIQYIQKVWNHQNQVSQFYDEICHLSLAGDSLNDFYVLVNDEKIIGCCGLIKNDVLKKADRYPWITSLYIDEVYRGRNYGQLLMNHVIHRAQLLGYPKVYLTTGKTDYYRRHGWRELESDLNEKTNKIYYKKLTEQR